MNTQRNHSNPLSGLFAILFIVFLVWLVFNFVKGLFFILSFLAIPLIILALIFNYKVVVNYFKWIYNLFKKDILKGLLATGGTILGYPLVAAWLFFKALSTRNKIRKEEKKKPGEYIRYEEVEEDEDFLELPDITEDPIQKKKDNNYDDLFN